MASWRDDGYQRWKKEQEEKKKKGETASKSPRNPIQYTRPSYRGESETRKESYQWEKDILKDLPVRRYGRSYNDKFNKWASEQGYSPSEAKEFRRFLDSRDDKVETTSEATDRIISGLTNKDKLEQFKKFNKERESAQQQKAVKEAEEKQKGSLAKDITTPAKRAFQALNPFDDVSFTEAFEKNVEDAVSSDRSKITKEATRALTRTANTGTLGALDQIYKKANGERTTQFTNEDRGTAGKVADFGYDALGYLVPGMGAYGALNASKAGKALTQFGSQGLKQRIGSEAAKGSLTGGALAGAEVGIREGLNPNDYTAKDNLIHLGIGVGAGAVADPLLYGAGRVAQNALSKYAKGNVPTYSGAPTQSVVDSLPNSSLARVGNQSDELFSRLSNVNRNNNPLEVPENLRSYYQSQNRLNQLAPEVEGYNRELQEAIEQQYQYLKNSMGKGVQPGGVVKDSEGYVTSAYGRVSNNPKWYQDFYSENGRKPNNKELRELAEQQVREGFEDEVGSLPAWSPRAVQEIDDQINDLNFLLSHEPHQESAIRPIIQALEEDRNGIMQSIENTRNEYANLSQQVEQIRPPQEVAPTLEQPSLNRLRRESLQPGRDYEPIESAPVNTSGGLARVPDELLDAQRQSQGNADTFRARIDRSPKKDEGLFSNLRTQFVDDMAPLEKIEKQIRGKIGSAENSLYKTARTFRGSAEKANLIVQEQLTPVLHQVKKNGMKIEDLGDYALAVHAKDVNEKGINSGFTNAEIEDVIRKLGTPEMEQTRQQLKAVNDHVLDILSTGDAPVLDPSDVAAMREKWPNYMSLFRSFDDDKVEFASGISKAMSVGSSPINRLQGSNRNVIDPMESIVKNIYKATNTADRNSVASQLGKLADEDTQGLIRKLADGEDAGRLNVISMMDKGKKVKYEVPPDVYKAMKNLDQESTNTLVKILQKPASTLRAGATLTPEFSLRNPLRDVPNAFIVSESGFNPLVDFPVGLWQSIWKGRTIKIGNKEFKTSGDLYKQFIKENGGYGNIVSMDRELHRKTLKKALTESSTQYIDVLDPKTYGAIIKKLANPLGTLRNIADVSETATKVGEFRAALRKGTTPQEAAYRARDIMDFARAGVSIREANKVVAFLNANIQGKSKLWRAFQKNPFKVGGKAIAAVTIPTIGAIVAQETLANDKQRKVLEDAPTWLKDTFYLVPIPGTDQIARIPKPFDLAYPFSNTLERAFAYAKKNDKEAFDGFIKQAFSAASVPVMLTGLAPIVEGMANYSFFRQGAIIPQREQNLEFPDQYDIDTSETAKLVGKGVNKLTGGQGAFRNFGSPRVVDNSIQGFFGGLGTYGVSLADGVINYFSDDEDKPEKPAKNIDQQPLAKAFLVNQSTSGKSLDQFYKFREQLTKARGSANQNEQSFSDENLYKKVNKMAKEISDINKEIRSVENHKGMSGEEKRKRLDKLVQQRNQFARQSVEDLKRSE